GGLPRPYRSDRAGGRRRVRGAIGRRDSRGRRQRGRRRHHPFPGLPEGARSAMIISRTPLRMSFVGGGSDLGVYYRENGGAVVSTAVDKYIYVSANRKFDNEIRLSYSKTENARTVAEIEHNIVRHALE